MIWTIACLASNARDIERGCYGYHCCGRL